MAKQLCLYCFEEFEPLDMLIRCRMDDPSICKPQVDETYDKFWGHSNPVPRGSIWNVPDPGFFKRPMQQVDREYSCPDCSTKSDLLSCPHCHNALPHPSDRKDEIILSLIGGPFSGKTVFLGMLLDEFNQVMSPRYALRPLTEEVAKRYRRIYRRPLDEGRLPGSTKRALQNPDSRHPLMFTLGGESVEQTYTVVLHDTAGEHFKDQNDLRRFNRYLVHSHGAMVFVDPEQLPKVRARLKDPPQDMGYRAIDLLNSAHDLVVKERNLPRRVVEMPLAVVLNKIDLLSDETATNNAPFIVPGFSLLEPSEHGPEFHEPHGRDVHDEVSSLLIKLGEGELVSNASVMFTDFMCFGMSPLGHIPNHDDLKLSADPEPQRLLDPFLWFLAQKNCIEYVE